MAAATASTLLSQFQIPRWAGRLKNVPNQFVKLAATPTAIERWVLEQVPADFELSIKRDDLTGTLSGGNKLRKLEVLFADALQQNATCVITCGSLQSNHCRATAVAARQLGLKCHLLHRSHNLEDDAKVATANLLINRLHGAQSYTVPYLSLAGGLTARVHKLASELKKKGEKPYIIPLGGSNNLGTFGIINSFQELLDQGLKDQFDDIVLATGSGGTLTGLGLGNYLTGEKLKVHGVCVSDDADYFNNFIEESLLQYGMKSTKANQICDIIEGYKYPGYGKTSAEDLDLIISIAQQSGVLLDYAYTLKAVKGMLSEMESNPQRFKGRRVLFIHTGGVYSVFDGMVGEAMQRHNDVKIWKDIDDDIL